MVSGEDGSADVSGRGKTLEDSSKLNYSHFEYEWNGHYKPARVVFNFLLTLHMMKTFGILQVG